MESFVGDRFMGYSVTLLGKTPGPWEGGLGGRHRIESELNIVNQNYCS